MSAGNNRSSNSGTQKVVELTKQERTVMRLICKGQSPKEIAYNLDRSTGMVNHHIASVYKKLGVNNRLAAFQELRRLGIVKG